MPVVLIGTPCRVARSVRRDQHLRRRRRARREPWRLLLICDDGHFYAYATDNGRPVEVEPSEDWKIDAGAALAS